MPSHAVAVRRMVAARQPSRDLATERAQAARQAARELETERAQAALELEIKTWQLNRMDDKAKFLQTEVRGLEARVASANQDRDAAKEKLEKVLLIVDRQRRELRSNGMEIQEMNSAYGLQAMHIADLQTSLAKYVMEEMRRNGDLLESDP